MPMAGAAAVSIKDECGLQLARLRIVRLRWARLVLECNGIRHVERMEERFECDL
jgi:hypothetical protein